MWQPTSSIQAKKKTNNQSFSLYNYCPKFFIIGFIIGILLMSVGLAVILTLYLRNK